MQVATETELAKALIVTAEMCGTELSRNAALAMVRELAEYDPDAVAKALKRCAREVTGRITLAAVIARIEDGHPGAEEAWALCPRDEAATVVWTDEIAEAFGVASSLLRDGDAVGARMAFRETYSRLTQEARDAGRRARWNVSLGHDVSGRKRAVLDAVKRGRLTEGDAMLYLPHEPASLPKLPAGGGSLGDVLAKVTPNYGGGR